MRTDAVASSSTATPSRWRRWLWLAPALCAAVTRWPALTCDFAMDDGYNVVGSQAIRSLRGVLASFGRGLDATSGDDWTAGMNRLYWRPFANASWALDYHLWGLWPPWFHGVNIVIHAANSLLLGALLRRLGVAAVPATLAACWWAVHAVHSETVTLVTYRTELLAGAAVLAGLLHAIRRGDDGHPGVLAAIWIVGLGCKESAAVLPLLWAAQVAWRAADAGDAPWRRLVQRWPTVVMFVAVGVGWLVLRRTLLRPTALPFFGALEPWDQLWSVAAVLGKEAMWTALAWPLAPFWDMTMLPPATSPWQPHALAGVLWLLTLLGVAWFASARAPRLALAARWWLLAIVPTAQLIPLPVGAAERFVYLAAAGGAIAMAAGLQALAPGRRLRALAAAVVLAWCTLHGALSWQRAWDFANDDTLIAATIRDFPEGFHGWHMQARRAWERGDAVTATKAAERGAAILPGFGPHEALRAQAWRMAGDPARAEAIEAAARGGGSLPVR